MPYVRTVKTASAATAVQIVYSLPPRFAEDRAPGVAHDGAQAMPLLRNQVADG